MKKVTLDLAALRVESFETHAETGSGTVVGAAAGGVATDGPAACSANDGCPSAWNYSCDGTCDPAESCGLTCGDSCGGLYTGCAGCSGPVCAA